MPWVAIFWYVAGAPRVPAFVWAITITQLILFAAFALNMALQYLRAWRSYSDLATSDRVMSRQQTITGIWFPQLAARDIDGREVTPPAGLPASGDGATAPG